MGWAFFPHFLFVFWDGGDLSACFLISLSLARSLQFLAWLGLSIDLPPVMNRYPGTWDENRKDGGQLGFVFFLGASVQLFFFLAVNLCCWTGMR